MDTTPAVETTTVETAPQTILPRDVVKVIMQTYEASIQSLVQDMKKDFETKLLSMTGQKKSGRKNPGSVVKDEPGVTLQQLHPEFVAKFFPGADPTHKISQKYVTQTVINWMFNLGTGTLKRDRNSYQLLNLAEEEIAILSQLESDDHPLNITTGDKHLINKIITTDSNITIGAHTYNLSNPVKALSEMSNNGLLNLDTEGHTVIRQTKNGEDIVELFRKSFGKKLPLEGTKVVQEKFVEYCKVVTQKPVNIYMVVHTDNLSMLETFKIPYVNLDGRLYTKSSLVKEVLNARMSGKPARFSPEDHAVLAEHFNSQNTEKISVDSVLAQLKCAKLV